MQGAQGSFGHMGALGVPAWMLAATYQPAGAYVTLPSYFVARQTYGSPDGFGAPSHPCDQTQFMPLTSRAANSMRRDMRRNYPKRTGMWIEKQIRKANAQRANARYECMRQEKRRVKEAGYQERKTVAARRKGSGGGTVGDTLSDVAGAGASAVDDIWGNDAPPEQQLVDTNMAIPAPAPGPSPTAIVGVGAVALIGIGVLAYATAPKKKGKR